MAEDRRQARLELAELVGVQELEAATAPSHQLALERGCGQGRIGLVNLEPTDLAQQ